MNEANLLVRFIIERFELRPKQLGAGARSGVVELGEYNRGRIIGLLERLLVFFFVLTGQMAALGFVSAAKGIARFKNLEDRDFAEYFLIGTMASVISAGLVSLITKHLLMG
ncbi:MAG: hypothetical protein FJW35_17470 [Acidobacteria bacterium]|nr:hypothetical protein [Acidobacteriota bacterium]